MQETVRELKNWPIAPTVESNRERIIRALREADGVVEQCFYALENGDARCALGVLMDEVGTLGLDGKAWGPDTSDSIISMNNKARLTFAEIAARLDADDSYWNAKASEPFNA